MLCTLAAWQRRAQIGLLPIARRGHRRGGLWYNLHFLACDWSIWDSWWWCCLPRSNQPSCPYYQYWWMLIISSNSACMSLPVAVDSSHWMNVIGKNCCNFTRQALIYPNIKVIFSCYTNLDSFMWFHSKEAPCLWLFDLMCSFLHF